MSCVFMSVISCVFRRRTNAVVRWFLDLLLLIQYILDLSLMLTNRPFLWWIIFRECFFTWWSLTKYLIKKALKLNHKYQNMKELLNKIIKIYKHNKNRVFSLFPQRVPLNLSYKLYLCSRQLRFHIYIFSNILTINQYIFI